MKEQEEIDYINRHKKQARQFCPNAVVVSVRRARAAVSRAYRKGLADATKPKGEIECILENYRKSENEFNEEDYE